MKKYKKTNKIGFAAVIAALTVCFSGCTGVENKGANITQANNNTTAISPNSSVNNNSQSSGSSSVSSDSPNSSDSSGNVQSPENTAGSTPPIENAKVINGDVVYRYKDHWWGVQLYAGGYNQKLYVDSVNAFAKDLENIAQVYSMVVPTNGEFYCPEQYNEYNASQLEDIQYIEKNLSSSVKSVNCYDVLKQHKDDDFLYFRTDHHWQALGAYYAAQKFAEAANVDFKELNEQNYEKKVIKGFVGSRYGTTGDANLLNDPDDFIYYVPQNDYKCYYYDMSYNLDGKYPFFIPQEPKNAFGTYMGSDKKIVRVETDVKNGRKLMIIKDSYGNVEIPFYMGSFEQIYVTDVRFFDLNAIDFIKQQGITDVLFTMCTFSAAGQNCEGIERMRTGAGHLIDW